MLGTPPTPQPVVQVPDPASQPKPVYFGGHQVIALPWHPLPYMQDYLTNLRVDGRVDDYVRMVRTGLARFSMFVHTQDVRHPEQIKRRHIIEFQAELLAITRDDGRPLSVRYRHQLLKYVRGWINWLYDTKVIDRNPWVRIKIGSLPKKPKPLEDDEVAALFEAHRAQAFSIPPFAFHRREVILVLLYGWGLRIHELHAINLANVDIRLSWVTVRNKGGGSKVLPYGLAMKNVVQRWLIQRAKHAVYGEDALLIDSQGKRLSIEMIRKIVTECGGKAGIAITPHRLRDTFGTTMLDHDVEVERIMKMMGHTNREQTLAYARVNDAKIKESHDRVFNPILERLLTQPLHPKRRRQQAGRW